MPAGRHVAIHPQNHRGLELDESKYAIRTLLGLEKDLQFRLKLLNEHDAAGRVVRGVHMRPNAGSHIDPGKHVQHLPLRSSSATPRSPTCGIWTAPCIGAQRFDGPLAPRVFNASRTLSAANVAGLIRTGSFPNDIAALSDMQSGGDAVRPRRSAWRSLRQPSCSASRLGRGTDIRPAASW
jgi:hypothetical protein